MLAISLIIFALVGRGAIAEPSCGTDEPNCPKYEHYVTEDTSCQKTCGNRLVAGQETAGACVPYTGCVCDVGYVRPYDNATGTCIPVHKCPRIPKKCGVNEVRTSCKIVCPPQSCESIFSSYYCIHTECEPGCNCKNKYLRDSNGVCILSDNCFREDKTTPPPPQCGRNEVLSDCAKSCPPQSCDSQYINYMCAEENCTIGCICRTGYLRNSAGKCIPSQHCPKDPNAPILLPSHPQLNYPSSHGRSSSSSRAYSSSHSHSSSSLSSSSASSSATSIIRSKAPRCKGNASWVECRSACPASCGDTGNRACIAMCLEPGCQCNTGYVLNDAGECVLPKDCPDKCKKHNATFSVCPGACPATCAEPESHKTCIEICLKPGCVCDYGYLLTDMNEKCVRPEDCPGGSPVCPANETYSGYKVGCPTNFCPVNDMLATVICDPAFPPPSGCVCQEGHLRLNQDDPRCILATDCPPVKCTRPNEEWNPQPLSCRQERCGDLIQPRECHGSYPYDRPACVCQYGYYRNDDNICVSGSECLHCEKRNATFSTCRSACPATCADPNTDTKPCIMMCMPPGCECKPGYVLTPAGGCILPKDCPVQCTDPNSSFSDCPSQCPATCGDTGDKGCILSCAKPGCVCNTGYVLSGPGGQCVLPENCPGQCKDPNASYSNCTSACPATCSNPGAASKPCIDVCKGPGCVCNPPYLLSEIGGECTLPEYCPDCYGDRNATFSECPSGCESTCADPDRNKVCKRHCLEPGCECKYGYIRTEIGGKCVHPEDCSIQCADPHASFSICPSSCPAMCGDTGDKSCIQVCADPGCVCDKGYVLSGPGGHCVLPENCPGQCDDPNAWYNTCPSPKCPPGKACAQVCGKPSCECKDGYKLSGPGGKCTPKSSPVQCKDPNSSFSDCPSHCPATCGDTGDKVCILSCAEPGCVCNTGYVLDGPGGQCVLPENCPGQCDDPNAWYNTCPSSECPPGMACAQVCGKPICECKDGYVQSGPGGKCLPKNSPAQCTDPNSSFNNCPSHCPAMCGDTGVKPCIKSCAEPGCVCNTGYVLSGIGGQCVLPENCPGRCDDPNAWYNTCPSPECPPGMACAQVCGKPSCECKDGYVQNGPGGKCVPVNSSGAATGSSPVDEFNCEARNATFKGCRSSCPGRCSTVNSGKKLYCATVCREPGCECKAGYVLDDSDKCILPKDCPGETCSVPKECRRTCGSPNPPNCPYAPIETNIDGCECIDGYILSQEGGKCIKIEECPSDQSCNGDPHARVKQCPPPCPSTCNSPNQSPCKRMCDPVGCVCEYGYIYSEEDEKCVQPSDCPGGDPCGPTAMFSSCNFDCPHNICPQDDSRGIILCKPPRDCPSGCVCKLNHKRLNYENRTCVVSSDCPPVDCTRPHEVWSGCPSDCLAENCEDVNNQPTTCETLVLNCQPKCICEKNYFRNSSDICIPAADCPKPAPQCGYNEIAVECRTICPPQNCEIAYTDYACGVTKCEPGCDCLPNHLRNGSGICILNDDCPYPTYPICGINEIARDCRRICPPQTCLSKIALFRCAENITCEAGCDCVANYLRDANGVCIPSKDCFATPTCSVAPECRRTCASPTPPNCPYQAADTNIDGCNCQDGYILSEEGGPCIRIEDCPADAGCNGDLHARVKRCPLPCKSTCSTPNAVQCKRQCEPIGCECTGGYIYSNELGRCILPDECKGGNPCGPNSRFVECKYSCPSDYCPVDDNMGIIACDPIPICLSGCICELNHKRLNYDNETCIVSSDCPPVECTRQNEVWAECPECLAELCSDANNPPSVCNTLVLNCQPKCICKKDHFRNLEGLCVSREECLSDSHC